MTTSDLNSTPDTAALTAAMMDYYKQHRDRLEIQSAALKSRLATVQAENQQLTERIAKLEASAAEVIADPPEQPAKPKRKEA